MNSQSENILFHRVSGTGHPVVFLHGFLESSSMWAYLEMPDTIQKIEVDLLGHGKSNGTDENVSMIQMAEQVFNLLKSLKIEKYFVVGHSMGGYVGLELMKLDRNCEKLVLLNSNFWNDSPEKVMNRKRVAKVVKTNKSHFLYEAIPNLFLNPEKYDKEVKGLILEARKMKSSAIAHVAIAMSKRSNNKELVALRQADILIIQGEDDSTVLKSEMERYLSDINLAYEVLNHTGHMAHIESPAKTKQLILSFLGIKKRK